MNTEYRALVEKVDGFTTAVGQRRRADLACRPGCSSCCEVWLTVSPVEAQPLRAALDALPTAARESVAQRGRQERAREARGEAARCAMLEPDGRCAVYEARPLVCRTQGLALQYPPGVVPEAAVRGRTSRGEITYCPLNFTGAQPGAADVLDAERVDQLLAIVSVRYAHAHGLDPAARTSLSDLAADAEP